MIGYKTSYILDKSEMLYLLSGFAAAPPLFPAQYILSQYLADGVVGPEAADGLLFKQILSLNDGKLVMEPVVNLMVRAALTADKLWIVGTEGDKTQFILRSKFMFMYIVEYPLIEGAWKIIPYQKAAEMVDELKAVAITSVNVVDEQERQYELTRRNGFSWLEEN